MIRRKKGEALYFNRMKYDGTQRKRRKFYFNNRRSIRRIKELDVLSRDIDFLIMELQKVEIRTGLKSLVSAKLRNLNIRLRYWEDRHNKYDSDYEAFKKISHEFGMKLDEIRRIVFDEKIEKQWWLIDNEGGNENQHYGRKGKTKRRIN